VALHRSASAFPALVCFSVPGRSRHVTSRALTMDPSPPLPVYPPLGRLHEAQGENHALVRYETGVPLPPAPARAPAPACNGGESNGSAPIAIGGGGDAGGPSTHWRSGANGHHSTSPMESDEGDAAAFPMSRSWDDCEVARSILNLNSPNGFHPLAGPPNGLGLPGGPDAFSLSAGGGSLAGSLPPMLPSHKLAMGSMLSSTAHSRKAS
jgi:hypothetical protein